jgi:hypothetical protein
VYLVLNVNMTKRRRRLHNSEPSSETVRKMKSECGASRAQETSAARGARAENAYPSCIHHDMTRTHSIFERVDKCIQNFERET